MNTWIVNIIGFALIGLILWWFLLAKQRATDVSGDSIDILVQNGVYEPAVIKAQLGQTLKLNFIRKDDNPCSAIVRFDDFEISETLPINKPHKIELILNKTGEFEFTCQMGMYRGKLVVTTVKQ